MQTISRKGDILIEWQACKEVYDAANMGLFLEIFNKRILSQKVKFPLLEFCAVEMHKLLPDDIQIPFCDAIEKLKTEGGNVILGKILQLRLPQHFDQSLKKATEYIGKADIWYVCDIIGERVFGYALLHYSNQTFPEFEKLSTHSINWVVRSLGAGGHYAIKKGLTKNYVQQLFEILLKMANTNDKEVRQGVGWAAKTTAKFHPDIISLYKSQVEDKDKVANWFRKKIKIGLNRHGYAQRN